MPELSEQLRTWVDAAPPVTVDEVEAAVSPGARRRPWLVAAVAAAAAAVLVVALVVWDRDEPSVTVDVTDEAAYQDRWAWLDVLGGASPPPPAPAGWTVLEIDDVQLAVPPGWQVPLPGSCALDRSAAGTVLLPGTDLVACFEAASNLVVFADDIAAADATTTPVTLGSLSVEARTDPGCVDCSPQYRLPNGHTVSFHGPEADAVAGTFGASSARLALGDGPTVGTEGWQTVSHGGVALDVPPTWDTIDLPASYRRVRQADGSVHESGSTNPGRCGWPLFQPGYNPATYLGASPLTPSCPFSPTVDLRPGTGAWLRTVDANDVSDLGPTVATGTLDGLDIAVVDVDRLSGGQIGSAIDLLINAPTATVHVTIGGGADTDITRTVLRSLRATGTTPAPSSTTDEEATGATQAQQAITDSASDQAITAGGDLLNPPTTEGTRATGLGDLPARARPLRTSLRRRTMCKLERIRSQTAWIPVLELPTDQGRC